MGSIKRMKTCVFTAVSQSFLPGFHAMMNSILTHTKNFDQEVIVLDIDLDDDSRDECLFTYHNCRFVKPDITKYQKLPKHTPALKSAFFKLEAFKIASQYDKLILIDSDIVFVRPINALLATKPVKDVLMCYHATHDEYNSGLIVFGKLPNTIYRSIINFMRTLDEANLADQTIIMEAIQAKLLSVNKLSCRWNVTKRHLRNDPPKHRFYAGLHFVGLKPWEGGEEGYEKIEKIWWRYAKR